MKLTYTEISELNIKNRQELKKYLNTETVKDKNVILKLSASWCGPCNRSTHELSTLLSDIKKGKLTNDNKKKLQEKKDTYIIEIDIDKYDDIASFLRVKTLPTIMSYFNGDVELVYNAMNYEKWLEFFNKLH